MGYDTLPHGAASIDYVAHIIQVALTPIFLLTGIGTLLNVFNTRLARVADRVEHTSDLLAKDPGGDGAPLLRIHLARLALRTLALDAAVGLAALAGATTCAAVITLFVGGVREAAAGAVLFAIFGIALLCTIASLAAFFVDTVLAWGGLKHEGALPHPGRAR